MTEAELDFAQKVHVFEQVYDHMVAQITSGALLPGERVKDSEWSTRLGISRTPVREAMRKLGQEGLLVALPAGGYEIRRLAADDLENLYRCRAGLEFAATHEATAAATPEQLDKIAAVVEENERAIAEGNLEKVFQLNSRFHNLIVEISGNAFIRDSLKSLGNMILLYRVNALRAARESSQEQGIYLKRLAKKQAAHRRIHEAMRRGEAEGAARLMYAHVCATVEDFDTIVETGPLAESRR
ncbi:MAG TPA: GntR family transcriptional regulator [Pseudolabrys sp.]|nr:GntR family transcriptional regulator [Pseudolabrys sp.]